MIDTKNFKIELIKIENFKSYRKPSSFGIIDLNSCIIGKNGSGKTNLTDAFIFSLGGNMKEINSLSIESIFPDFYLKKNYITSKVGLLISYRNVFFEIIRTIDINGISEFFFNGNSISFYYYKTILKQFCIKNFKDLIILRNLVNNIIFLQNKNLNHLIYRISNSNNLFKIRLKINLLKNKLKENYFFFFQKIKYIKNEKNLLKKDKYNFIKLLNLRKNQKIIKIYDCYFKKCLYFNENWKLNETIKKIFNQKRELKFLKILIPLTLFNYNNFSEKIIKKNDKIKYILLICGYLLARIQKVIKLFSTVINKYFIFLFSKFTEKIYIEPYKQKKSYYKILLYLVKNQYYFAYNFYVKNLSYFIKPISYIELNTIIDYNQISFFSISNVTGKKMMEKLNLLIKLNFSTIFFIKIQDWSNFCSNKWKIKLNYKKILNDSFFFTVSFILILVFAKEVDKFDKYIRNNSESNCLAKVKKIPYEIRGIFKDLIKPLDSKYKLVMKNFTEKNLNTIIVDNMKIALDCIAFIKLKNIQKVSFLSRKEANDMTSQFTIQIKKNFRIILKFLEIDYYDINFFIFMNCKSFSSNDSFFASLLLESKEYNSFCCNRNNLVENLNYQTISLLPDKLKEKKMNSIGKLYKNKKILLSKTLNREISYVLKKRSIYLKLSKKNTNYINIYLKIFPIYLNSASIFFILNIGFSNTLHSFLKIFYINCKINFFNLIIFIYKFNKNKFINSRKKLQLIFIKKAVFFIYKIKKQIGCFVNTKSKVLQHEKHRNNFSLPKIFIIIKIIYITEKRFIYYLTTNIRIRLSKIVEYLKKSEKLKKSTNIFFFQISDCFFFKKKHSFDYTKKQKIKVIISKLILFGIFMLSNSKNIGKCYFVWTRLWTKKYKKVDFSIFFKKNSKFGFLLKKLKKKTLEYNQSIKKKLCIEKIISFKKRLEFIQKRYLYLKSNMLKNKYQQLLIELRLDKIQKNINKKFDLYFFLISKKVNFIYKEITKTLSNPLGGTAFLTFIKDDFTKSEKVVYNAVPSSRKSYNIVNLSGGEKTMASFALIMAINTICRPLVIFCDELDYNLDGWHSEKIMKYLLNWSEKKEIKVLIITLKLRFAILYQCIIFIFKTSVGSDFYKLYL